MVEVGLAQLVGAAAHGLEYVPRSLPGGDVADPGQRTVGLSGLKEVANHVDGDSADEAS
jgi:hypothetical protein